VCGHVYRAFFHWKGKGAGPGMAGGNLRSGKGPCDLHAEFLWESKGKMVEGP